MLIITNSDRTNFKRCKRKHFFESHHHLNKQPLQKNPHLSFGSAIHKALEDYYLSNPRVIDIDNFQNVCVENDIFEDLVELGSSMLQNYARWAPTVDNFKVIDAEVSFAVPLFDDVVFKGVIDLIVEDNRGIWIMDHKTTGVLDNTYFMETEDQITSYIWALQKEWGIEVIGGIYNELIKKKTKYPEPMARQRNGRWFSTNKANKVILADFLSALEEFDEDKKDYAEYLDYLSLNPNPFFRRTELFRTSTEIERAGSYVLYDAADILSYPPPIPSPSKFNCNNCSFREPCKSFNEGRDYEFLLENLYEDRKYRTVE